jgi:hypothetical protein
LFGEPRSRLLDSATGAFHGTVTTVAGAARRAVTQTGTAATVWPQRRSSSTIRPATSIPLGYPSDAEPTAEGGVLIANTGNDDIRYVTPDGTISTVAGEGTCDDATTSCKGLAATQVALDQPASVSPIQGGSGGYLIADSPIRAARLKLNGHADVAQLVEHFTRNEGVPGSSPGVGSQKAPEIGAFCLGRRMRGKASCSARG